MFGLRNTSERRVSSFLHAHAKDVTVGIVLLLSAVYCLYCYTIPDSKIVLVFSGIVLVADIILYVLIDRMYNRGRMTLDVACIIILAFSELLYCMVFAPGEVPDEAYHYVVSYRYSDLLMFQPATDSGLMMRYDDSLFLAVLDTVNINRGDYADIASSSFLAHDSTLVFVNRSQGADLGNSLPQLKIFSAIGITIGRLLGLGSYPVFYLGRLFNIAFFIILIFFSLRLIPLAKNVIRIAVLLPMTLHLAGSYSYDAGIIGFAFLLTALCFKAIYDEDPLSKWTLVGIGAITFLIAPCKVVYTVIAMCVFFIPTKKFSSKKKACLFKFGVLGIAFLAILITKLATFAEMAGIDSEVVMQYREDGQGHYYTLPALLSDPLKFFFIFVKTLDGMGDAYLFTLIGGSLGWFQPGLEYHWYFVFALLLILLMSALPMPNDRTVLKPSQRLACIILGIVGCMGILMSMLIGWTFDDSLVIQGVQGRYFIPLLPLLLIAIRGNTITSKRNLSWALMFTMLVLNTVYLVHTFAMALIL